MDANGARGISVWVEGDGSDTVRTDPGTSINVSDPNLWGPGIYLLSGVATAANGRSLTANVASEVTGIGPNSPSTTMLGIRVVSSADAPISVTYTGPGITVARMNSIGIGATSPGGGRIAIESSGPITTTNSVGAFGIRAITEGKPVNVTASSVSATGDFSYGFQATIGGDVSITIPQGGSVMSRWQAESDHAARRRRPGARHSFGKHHPPAETEYGRRSCAHRG